MKFKIETVLCQPNGITNINCIILESNLILTNNKEYIMDNKIKNGNKFDIDNNDVNKFVIKIKIETKINDKEEYLSDIGILCNIPSKNLKCLITYNHFIDFDFLNEGKKMMLYLENNVKEIDIKINRFKYTNKELNITIIEILEIDNINQFIEIDELINSKNYNNTNIISLYLNEDKNIESSFGKIKEKDNNKYICDIESKKEGIIILKENCKLIGINNNDDDKFIITMNIIINKINCIKCIYEIKKEDIGMEIQIINNQNYLGHLNREIEKEIKIILNGEIKSNTLKYKFNKEGIYIIYLVTYNFLTYMSFMFYNCSLLKKVDLLSVNTSQVTDMSEMFHNCTSLEELNLSSFNTEQVTDMSNMFSYCSSLKKLNLSSFNTNQVTDMSNMFCVCSSLTELNLSSFNTEQVTNMSNIFSNCSSLTELNLSSFNTNK